MTVCTTFFLAFHGLLFAVMAGKVYFCRRLSLFKPLKRKAMGIIIGIDVGTSTTKIVGLHDGIVAAPECIRATDPVTSLYGAFGKYLFDNKVSLGDVEHVMLTGVGAAYADPTQKRIDAKGEDGTPQAIVIGTTWTKYPGSWNEETQEWEEGANVTKPAFTYWQWPIECVDVTEAYPDIQDWIADPTNFDWLQTGVSSKLYPIE